MAYNVTIGATNPGTADAHFSTWAAFLQSGRPGITPTDWTVTFLDGQEHLATSGQVSLIQGSWYEDANSLTVTSEGFTGIPYGQPGGSTSRLSFPFSATFKIFYGASLGALVKTLKFTDMEIKLGSGSGSAQALVKTENTGTNCHLIFDRCVFIHVPFHLLLILLSKVEC